MKLLFKNAKFAVFDDVLPQEMFERVWLHAQIENYSLPSSAGWVKVWRIGDSFPLGGPEYHWSKRPFNNYMDLVGHFFNEIGKNCTEILGDETEWGDLVLRSYLYPRGTKLSWHNDAANYAGAFTYYIHPKWGSTWGGELMVAEVPPMEDIKHKPMVGPHLEHEWEDEYIGERGVGQFISPKPNRCVVMAGGTYHSINRVDADAGDHARASVVGFLTTHRQEKKKFTVEDDDAIDLKITTL
jgi:hypothetical protein